MTKITASHLLRMKAAGEKIVSLTAYDASFSTLLNDAGVEVILVGDSLGMVLHGENDTLNVSMEDMIYHTRLVASHSSTAMVVADMPHQSYLNAEQALTNAKRLVDEGNADIVKLERGEAEVCEIVKHIVEAGIHVCGHLGLTPQSVEELGGYKVQGRDPDSAKKIKQEALALEAAGASVLVLECVPAELAKEITSMLKIPVIGIGAGSACDGQVLVIYDLLGISGKAPRFSKNFLQGAASIQDAVSAYVKAVKSVEFPASEHQFD